MGATMMVFSTVLVAIFMVMVGVAGIAVRLWCAAVPIVAGIAGWRCP